MSFHDNFTKANSEIIFSDFLETVTYTPSDGSAPETVSAIVDPKDMDSKSFNNTVLHNISLFPTTVIPAYGDVVTLANGDEYVVLGIIDRQLDMYVLRVFTGEEPSYGED